LAKAKKRVSLRKANRGVPNKLPWLNNYKNRKAINNIRHLETISN
jgi:hypothetical protein